MHNSDNGMAYKVTEERTYEILTRDDFRQLKDLALKEHDAFFERNLHLREAYRDKLIAICLCQGAASHYVSPSVGIKDFDIWLFYEDCPGVRFPHRSRKRDDNAYVGKPIEWLRRSIPTEIVNGSLDSAAKVLKSYIDMHAKSKWQLLKKAIVGLYPEQIFGEVIWRVEH